MKKTKDPVVELLRIIGALMVIGTHIQLGGVVDGEIDGIRILISCFVGDGVAIFWMVLGFFFFESDWELHVKRTIKHIFIPMILYSILMYYFYDFIMGEVTLMESIYHTKDDYIAVLKSIFKWQPFAPATGQFWYLYVYMIIILLFPFIKGGVEYITKDLSESRCRLFVALLALLFFNDISFNGFLEVSHHSFSGALGGIIFVILGSVLYKEKDRFQDNKIIGLFGLLVYFAFNSLRAVIQYFCFQLPNMTAEPIFWYTGYAAIATTSLIVFVYGYSGFAKNHAYVKGIALHFGKMTLYVYFVHMLIIDYLNKKGINNDLISRFGTKGSGALKYEIVMILIVSIASLFISEVFFGVKRLIKSLYTGRNSIA